MWMKKTILITSFLCLAGTMTCIADVIAVHEDDFEDRNIGDPTEGWHWYDNAVSHVGQYVDFEGSIVREQSGTLFADINQRFGYKTDIEMTGNTSVDPCDYTFELDIRNLQGNWDPHLIEIWVLTYNPDTGGGTYGYGLPILELNQADEWVHVEYNLGDLVKLGRAWWEGTGWDMTNPMWSYEIGGPPWPGVEIEEDWTQVFLVDNLKITMYAEPAELAREPVPEDQSIDIPRDVVFSWKSGDFADKQNVYFGTDPNDVNEASTDNPLGVLVGQDQQETTYDPPGLLDYNQTYYWRIDGVSDTDPNSPWKGRLWSFTTANFIVVDDFESYNDRPEDAEGSNLIYYTWIDGYDNPSNGSTIGYNEPFQPTMETEIVHSGNQSVPLFYDNAAGLSEVVRTFDSPVDWTRPEDELLVLVLYFEGDPDNSAEPFYIAVEDSSGTIKVITHENPNATQLDGWQEWNILLSDLSDAGVNLSAVKKIYLGMGNRDNPQAGGGTGQVFIDDLRVYRRRCVSSLAKPEYDLNNDCIVNQADLDLLMTEYGRSLVNPADIAEVYLEAESAVSISSPMGISDDADASAGQYITVDAGSNSTNNPPTTGIASYNITVNGGTYLILGRTIAPTGDDDSFWLRIQGATTQTNNHSSGWIRWGVVGSADWSWGSVQSMDDASAVVQFTMAAGTYTLEIAYREDGALLDSILLTDDLDFDTAILAPLLYDFNGDDTTDDADVALLMEQWLDEVLWP